MYILIDNSSYEEIKLVCSSEGVEQELSFIKKDSTVLGSIDKILHKYGKKISDIQGIAVVIKKGSFSATRIVVTVANVFAYCLRIPVIGIEEHDKKMFVQKIEQHTVGTYIHADYSSEPHVHI
jgi:tRNA A37 threonylcarbamoyladenosine modification protein TsaB